MPTYEAHIYRGDERVDTRDVEASDHLEVEEKIRASLKNSEVTYDVEVVLK